MLRKNILTANRINHNFFVLTHSNAPSLLFLFWKLKKSWTKRGRFNKIKNKEPINIKNRAYTNQVKGKTVHLCHVSHPPWNDWIPWLSSENCFVKIPSTNFWIFKIKISDKWHHSHYLCIWSFLYFICRIQGKKLRIEKRNQRVLLASKRLKIQD